MTAIIRTEKLTKSYGAHRGIIDVDLEVQAGEVFGFLGPNGAGKTTTIRTLLDLIRPTSGRGVRVRHRVDASTRSRSTGGSATSRASSRSTTASPAARRSHYFANLRGGVDRGLPGARSSSASTSTRAASSRSYSKGNKQKIGLVIALQHRPELLILDEPTSGLDPLVQQSFYALVREAQGRGPDGLPVEPHPVARSSGPATASRSSATAGSSRSTASRACATWPTTRSSCGSPGAVPGRRVRRPARRVRRRGRGPRRCGCASPAPITPVVQAAARYELLDFVSREPTPRGDVPRPVRQRPAGGGVGMTASPGRRPAGPAGPPTSAFSRIYGLGSVYAKTLRDSRLAVIIVGGLIGGFLLSSGVAFGEAYATVESRLELKALVAALPPAMAGVYGNPFPTAIETLGGSIAWKTGGVARADGRAVVRPRAVRDARQRGPPRQHRVRRHDAARHAPDRPREACRASHRDGDRRARRPLSAPTSRGRFGTLPGDAISWTSALGFAALGRRRRTRVGIGRLRARTVRRTRRIGGDRGRGPPVRLLRNGYQDAAPAFAPFANLTWWGWTVHHQPLAGQLRLGCRSCPAHRAHDRRCSSSGSTLFARRDLGAVQRIPWPRMPSFALGLGGPFSRSLGERLPLAFWWGIGIGLLGFVFGAAAPSFTRDAPGPVAGHARDLQGRVPEDRPPVGRRRVPPARVHHVRAHPRRVSPRRPSSRAGRRTRPTAGSRSSCRRPCRAPGGRSAAASACTPRSA